MRLIRLSIFLAALAASAPASAQLRDLQVPATSGWKHAITGLILRKQLAGYPRTSLADNGAGELDVVAGFGAPDGSTEINVYLFRPAQFGVPVWFDRAETQIQLRPIFAKPQPVAAPQPFAPPGRTVASALRRIYVPGKGPWRSTGVAMMPLGDWLVAVRVSSTQFDPATLDGKISEIVAAIGWPAGAAEGQPAAPIVACAKPLAYAKRARLQRSTLADSLMGAVLAGITLDEEKKDEAKPAEPITPITWCRDAFAATSEYAVYRDAADAEGNSYSMALGDSGRVIHVYPSFDVIEGATKGFALSFADLDGTSVYPVFDKFADPKTAFDAVTKTAPTSRASGKNVTITMPR